MSHSHVDMLNEVRKLYPNQPLFMIELDGELEIVPVGYRFFLTTPHTVTVRGLINPDDSMVVSP